MIGNLSGKQILLLILAVIILLYIVNRYWCDQSGGTSMETMSTGYKPTNDHNTTGYRSSTENMHMSDRSTPFVLYNFYSPMCVWCKKFWPTWEEFDKKMKMSKNLSLVGVNASDPKNEQLAFYYNVSSYPTIILVTPDKNIEYVGNRSIEDLHDFVMKYMQDYYSKN